jgi:serine/threonine protein kinase
VGSEPESLTRLATALLPRYAIEAEIGAGGMATVYLAQDLRHNRKVAVKVLIPEVTESLGAARFLREIEIAAGLTHPHILPLFDSGEAGGLLYFVMPYVKGESLRNRLDREGQLPVDDAIRITREVASALAHAHEEGIVHRDVKPSNILLESGHAVPADFGVGCVLYEMLAGHPPFTGAQLETVIRQHLVVPPAPVTHARPAVPAAIEGAWSGRWPRTPPIRFRNMYEFASALAQTESPAKARQNGTAWSVRSPRVLVGVLLVVALASWFLPSRSAGNGEGDRVPATSGPEKPSLALFLCDNYSPNPDDSYLADGIHQEFLSMLEKIAGISSMGRKTVETYRDDPRPLPAKAAELGVDYVGECSVTKAPDSEEIRITVSLLDAAGEIVWGDTYDQDLSAASYFEMLSDVARQLADGLGAFLTPREEGLLSMRPTEVDEAWDLYLRGRDYYIRPGFRDENRVCAPRLKYMSTLRGFSCRVRRQVSSHSGHAPSRR